MTRKKVTKASKRRLLLFGTLSLVIMIYFFMSLFSYGYHIWKLQKEEKSLQYNLTTLQKDEKNLKIEIEKLKDPEYLARYARENYLYSKTGEIVIKVQPTNKEQKKQREQELDYTYIVFGGSLILLFIIGYVVKKSKK